MRRTHVLPDVMPAWNESAVTRRELMRRTHVLPDVVPALNAEQHLKVEQVAAHSMRPPHDDDLNADLLMAGHPL